MAGGGREERCGTYRLFTDVTDRPLLQACDQLAGQLDAVYTSRYGLEPFGTPEEGIFLFATLEGYRAFAAQDQRMGVGYAGFTSGVRGFTALYAGDQKPVEVLSTLTHELTHLVSRRALGPNLAPWLSEGLADGIGDTATREGFQPLRAFRGAEPQAKRLVEAYRSARAQGLRRLTTLKRGDFDRAIVSFDYEQSALLLRFLLQSQELAPRFRTLLDQMAGEGLRETPDLAASLGLGWSELEARFEAWLLG